MNVPTTDGGGDSGDKQCPPFCSADGQPHGPSRGDGSTNVNSDGSPGGGGTASTDSSGNTGSSGSSGGGSSSGGTVWGWLSDAGDTIANYGSAIFSHPEIFWGAAETAGGIALTGLGSDIAAGGAIVCLSGVGCFLGGPAVAVGVGIAGIGVSGAADGIRRTGDGVGKALREADSNASGSASSSSEAPSWIPDSATRKVPDSLGDGKATKKGIGWRWNDGRGNGVRIDQGNPNNSQEFQQVDHVVINSGGRIIGRNGRPVEGDIKSNAYDAHIPLEDWLTWKTWNSPN